MINIKTSRLFCRWFFFFQRQTLNLYNVDNNTVDILTYLYDIITIQFLIIYLYYVIVAMETDWRRGCTGGYNIDQLFTHLPMYIINLAMCVRVSVWVCVCVWVSDSVCVGVTRCQICKYRAHINITKCVHVSVYIYIDRRV